MSPRIGRRTRAIKRAQLPRDELFITSKLWNDRRRPADVREALHRTLADLRQAGVKVWMLTGDKLETATCIAKSSKLVSRTQSIHIFKVKDEYDRISLLTFFLTKSTVFYIVRLRTVVQNLLNILNKKTKQKSH